MLYRPLGRSGLTVSEIGFGCAGWWGKPAFPEAQAVGLVRAAVDGGVTFFDTGASYSAGEAEPRLGRALKGLDAAKLVIATKAGTFHTGGGRIGRDFRPASIVASAERSLRNLGLEALPLLQLHGPAVEELTDELVGTLESLKARGLVRALGVNSFEPAVIDHALALPFDAVMIDYNVLRPDREPLIARARAAGKGVLAGMPLAMGHTNLKVARLRGPQDIWYAARGLVRHRREVLDGARFHFVRPQAALAYVLANRGVACAVVGTTRPAHLADNLAASGMALPDDTLARIRRAQAAIGR